jgi:UPF0755 protein
VKLRRLIAVAAVGCLLAGIVGYNAVTRWLSTPLQIAGESILIEIPRGQPLGVTARELASRGVLDHPQLLLAYARYTGADSRIHAGEYRIAAGTTPLELLDLLQEGAVVQHAITFLEGWTFRDLRRALQKAEPLEHRTMGMSDQEVMAALGEPGQHPEGLFFPDTYFYGKGMTDLELLAIARQRMQRELDAAWQERERDIPVSSPYEALVLASIVEKETALPSERRRVAGVMTTRLKRGMRLQTDPTVIYGIGPDYDGNLRRADLERDTPYNTYTRQGLPPTPIAMPGAESIRAAVQPDERGELYFVATGLPDGSHKFSRTLAEHQKAVKEYLVRYRQQNRGR